MKPYKICCITYKILDRLIKETLLQHDDPELEITIVEGLQDEIVKGLEAAEEAGCEVAIGRGANARIAREMSDIPVLEYQLTACDYFDALENALALGDKIALVTYRNPVDSDLAKYVRRRNIAFANIVYETDDELRRGIQSHRDFVILGAAHAVDLAEELGCKSASIYPGQAAVLGALREAKALGLEVVGLLGLLVRAKRMGIIDKLRPYVEKLVAAGARYSPKLLREVLTNVGEWG